MKMKQISDSTLKITIKMEDLEDRGMELSDFLMPQEKTEEFFYAVLDELDLPTNFLESGMLSFRVTPKPDKIDIFVTKSEVDQELDFDDFSDLPSMEDVAHMSPDEFIKTLETSIRKKSERDEKATDYLEEVEQRLEDEYADHLKDEPYVYYILAFDTMRDLVQYAKLVDYAVEGSEVYKMSERYYLTVLVRIENCEKGYPAWLLARMVEHAEGVELSRSVLLEHGRLLVEENALKELRKVQLP